MREALLGGEITLYYVDPPLGAGEPDPWRVAGWLGLGFVGAQLVLTAMEPAPYASRLWALSDRPSGRSSCLCCSVSCTIP
jgi:hypothetical protein